MNKNYKLELGKVDYRIPISSGVKNKTEIWVDKDGLKLV